MTEREFIVWLRGFLAGVGDNPSQKHWDTMVAEISKLDVVDLDTGKSRKILHDGVLNITREGSRKQ